MSTLIEKYKSSVIDILQKEIGYKNTHQIPKITKVVINVGAGEAIQNVKCLDVIQEYIGEIAGQKPIVRKAKKSIAGFKLREGMPIGVKVTLRRQRMYDFLERLINTTLPRVRDFNGISAKAFDGAGNYTLGIKEQLVFPEVNYEKIDQVRGMNITIVTTAKSDDEARLLLSSLGLPFRKS
ncbi:MAG: 50S ribosomal protein L5 [Deltaproteobacteria bacterium]|nr:50S ribosomal protein L5 [Deltaproteobacteria bacterium]MBT4089444.1 50S ribosomal protein L5 [Deltaproteobacteria bacterium]MBT4266371.1 50S ribosomal protein L5 [Deltaproteobacteria bacterium]MBT4643945.1 50S ribosomal protein L5 [Deltaproteobacteria bacterium]MBT6502103.1 50S ribosomal protein L5 [Deltaproteobacteria bacterium]